MLNHVLKFYALNGIKDVVFAEDKNNLLSLGCLDHFDVSYIQDARSASFFAYGKAKMNQKMVLLIVDESFIPSIYTAITETWFQKVPLIIISYNVRNYSDTEYLRRCVLQSYCIKSIDDTNLLELSLKADGPVLIRMKETIEYETFYCYNELLDCFSSLLSTSDCVFCYNSSSLTDSYNYTVHNIDYVHKYGIISKYVGWITASESRDILCINEELLALDSNIFNFRNLPSTFKLLIVGNGSGLWHKEERWVISNHIKVIKSDMVNNGIARELIEANSATVLYLNR